MTKPPIKCAIVGFGFSGSTFHAPFLNRLEDYDLACIVSSNPEKVCAHLSNVDVEPDYSKALERKDLDLVVITTPSATHYEMAKAALEAGKHVVVDKPFTLYSREALDLIQLAKKKDCILTVYHNRRWDGDFLTTKKLLAEQVLGEIYLFEAHYHRYRPIVNLQRWKESDRDGSGILYDLGSHLIDQALQLFGLPDSVDADIFPQRPGAVAIDYFHLILKYGAKRVILKSCTLVPHAGPRYQLHGTHGSFLKNGIDPQEQDLLAGKNPFDPNWGKAKQEDDGILTIGQEHKRVPTTSGNYAGFYTSLAQAIHKNTPPPVLPEEAYQVIKIIEEARYQNGGADKALLTKMVG